MFLREPVYFLKYFQFISWFHKNTFLLKEGCVTMRNYVETFQCKNTYNVAYKAFT